MAKVTTSGKSKEQVALEEFLQTEGGISEAETKKRLNKSAQQLEIDKQNAQLQAERDTMKMERLVQDKAYQLAEVESNAEVKAAAAEKAMQLKIETEAMELEMLEKRLAIEKTLSPVNLQKMHLDAVQNVYAKLPLKEVKLVNMTGGQGALGGLGGLIPGLAEATKQVTGSNDVWDTMSDKSR